MLFERRPPMTLTHEPLSTTDNSFPEPNYPYDESHIGLTELMPTHRVDLRPDGPDVFYDADPVSDWASLTWDDIGKPYRVERWSSDKKAWEKENNQEMPVKTAWEHFNRSFQSLFDAAALEARKKALREMGVSLKGVN